MNKAYAKGYRWERQVKAMFEKQECLVIRQGKSRFPDLIVFTYDGPMFIECKVGKYLTKGEKDASKPLLAYGKFYIAVPHIHNRRKYCHLMDLNYEIQEAHRV